MTSTPGDLAKTVRSKNAGTDRITFDVIFGNAADYERTKASGALTRETVAALFNVPVTRIVDFVNFDPAYAFKFTIACLVPSGSPGEGDIFGCQQYPPLLDVVIPDAPGSG